ncbi:MAG: menaquinone biosynthesis protein [Planctomycetes bacterium]|nr:menaquinone biosynthesis protein [Planctomycetota bacterium]
MASQARLRIGAVSYLNTRPLVYGLDRLAPEATIVYDLPSRLADGLAAGRLDVALIPSVEYLQDPSYTLVSDACIACRGPVMSVKLLSRTPMRRIRTLALDEGSRTSIALVRILLEQRFGLRPELSPLPIGARAEEATTDALLLIGDRAMHPPSGFVEQWDLGEEWTRWAEVPFVFAMWTARAGADVGELESALIAARDAGVSNLREIAETEAPRVGLSFEACLGYLRDNLHFYLGSRERQGLYLFAEHAARLGLAPCG